MTPANAVSLPGIAGRAMPILPVLDRTSLTNILNPVLAAVGAAEAALGGFGFTLQAGQSVPGVLGGLAAGTLTEAQAVQIFGV